ncbi:MAG: hypothetical protein Q4A44_05235 [Bacteroidales bacterium]|nr:hypothetical protein [Bacteroidales bacterium]
MLTANSFIAALTAHVAEVIRREGGDIEYCTEAVRIVDAHNATFTTQPRGQTDESVGLYTIRDLSRLRDDASFLYQPDNERIARIAAHYF